MSIKSIRSSPSPPLTVSRAAARGDEVVAALTVELIVAIAAEQDIVQRAARDLVVARRVVEHDEPFDAGNGQAERGPPDDTIRRITDRQRLRGTAAGVKIQRVGASTAIDEIRGPSRR